MTLGAKMTGPTSTRAIERELDILQLLQANNGVMTQFVDIVRGMTVNGVLDNELVTLAAGVWSREFSVPYAYVMVVNLGVGPMTITNDATHGPGGAPTSGTGVHLLPARAGIGINLAGRSLTIYGTAGDQANVEVFTRPQPPFYGPVT